MCVKKLTCGTLISACVHRSVHATMRGRKLVPFHNCSLNPGKTSQLSDGQGRRTRRDNDVAEHHLCLSWKRRYHVLWDQPATQLHTRRESNLRVPERCSTSQMSERKLRPERCDARFHLNFGRYRCQWAFQVTLLSIQQQTAPASLTSYGVKF